MRRRRRRRRRRGRRRVDGAATAGQSLRHSIPSRPVSLTAGARTRGPRDRHTDRQTDGRTDRQMEREREADRQPDRSTERSKGRTAYLAIKTVSKGVESHEKSEYSMIGHALRKADRSTEGQAKQKCEEDRYRRSLTGNQNGMNAEEIGPVHGTNSIRNTHQQHLKGKCTKVKGLWHRTLLNSDPDRQTVRQTDE